MYFKQPLSFSDISLIHSAYVRYDVFKGLFSWLETHALTTLPSAGSIDVLPALKVQYHEPRKFNIVVVTS